MQEDLNIRVYDDAPDLIECPKCKYKHDIIKTCKCGMTYENLQEELTKQLKESVEKISGDSMTKNGVESND